MSLKPCCPSGSLFALPIRTLSRTEFIKKLIELGLLNWSVIALGLKNNWTNKKNIIDYAVNLLKNGDNNINIVSIAAGEYLDSHEFFSIYT
jgi:hypothetical protein